MKVAWYSKKWFIVLIHALAWMLLFSLPNLLRPNYNEQPQQNTVAENARFYFSVVMNATWIAFFYLNGLFFIPRFVYKKKYWQYAVILIAIFCGLIAETRILSILLRDEAHYSLRRHLLFTFFIFLFILAASTAYQMIRDRM